MRPSAPWIEPVIPFDLGNLSAVKVGDEVTTLDEQGHPSSRILIVHLIESWRVLVRHPDRPVSCGHWLTKNKGGAPYAMHDQNVMRFYYSANPEHIACAKANAAAALTEEQARKAAFALVLEQARPIGEALGDGWQNGSNGGDDYYSTGIAQTLAECLTPEQIATLAGWLKL